MSAPIERYLPQIRIQTPESLALNMPLAGVGNRALALAIDYGILTILLLGYGISLLAAAQVLVDFALTLGWEEEHLMLWIFALAGLVYYAIYVGYFVFFETLWHGQTPGKRWGRVRVMQADGRPVGLSQSVLRALVRPVDDLAGVGVWLIVLTPRQQRLGDLLAGTVVVQTVVAPPSALPGSEGVQTELQALTRQGIAIPPCSVEVARIVRQFLRQQAEMLPAPRQRVAQDLAQSVLGQWADPPRGLVDLADRDPLLFLQVVWGDWQRLAGAENRSSQS